MTEEIENIHPFDAIADRAHVMAPADVLSGLETDGDRGLTSTESVSRLELFGPNKIPEQQTTTAWERLWEQINSMIIYILIVGAAISFAFDHPIDGIVIIGVVVINVGLGYYMESQAVGATNALKNMMSAAALTIRDGEKENVDSLTLTPGDIILVQPGDVVPADARILKQSNLQVMEAALTGESHAIMKDVASNAEVTAGLADRKCIVFSGSQVLKGTATCVVIATGADCEIGKISGLLSEIKPEKTPLLVQLERFGLILSLIIIGFSFGAFGIAVARGYSIDEALSIAIGVAVAAIPEGLPSCITVTFAKGVSFMAGRHAIVKSLPAVETLGSVSVICSDKTGTLTMNKMAVKSVVCPDTGVVEIGDAMVAAAAGHKERTAEEVYGFALPGILCNDSCLIISADGGTTEASVPAAESDIELAPVATETDDAEAVGDRSRGYVIKGDPTESCIFEMAVQLLGAPQAVKQLLTSHARLDEVPFDSATKFMATLHLMDASLVAKMTGNKVHSGDEHQHVKVVLVKGAPERVMSFCFPPGDAERKYWSEQAEGRAQNGMRVLGLACRVVSNDFNFTDHPLQDAKEGSSERFHMTSLLGIIDPPRPEAILAVADAQAAGIVVKMITGDHPITALAIGKTLGLQVPQNRAITGTELDEIMIRSMAELDSVVVDNDVFARTTPEHKLRIVESLRRQGYVCSMTGDGVNDAPALKAANIGVAMGITGTEVAKDAANMVITDDNFATIVDAIRIGRCTYANLIKIIAFVLPTNGGQAFSIIGALIIDVATPITALQILWVNMITSVTLGIVLAFDKPDRTVLSEAPRRSNKPIFGKLLTWRVSLVTVFLILAVLGMYRWENYRGHSADYLRTVCVNTLVTAQVGYIFNCRNLRNTTDAEGFFMGNPYLYLGIFVIIGCQMLFTYSPGFQYVFQTENIDGESWGKIILMAVVVFCAVEVDKILNAWRRQWLGAGADAPYQQVVTKSLDGRPALSRRPSAGSIQSKSSARSARSRRSANHL